MKVVIGFLLFLLILTGCGTNNIKEGQQGKEQTNGSDSGIVAGEMEPSLRVITPLHFEYKLKNQTEDHITLEFTSSQRIDYSVSTKEGEEIFLYSSTASFLAALSEEEFLPGEELTYEINLSELNLQKGGYTLSVWMTPKEGKMYELKSEFEVK